MSDTEIQILIKAQDEATQVLKKIENSVSQTAKNSETANQSLSNSFSKVQGAMLNLGQIAQGVHNIFETGQRVTRNLENAQDRLENATLRLKGANQDLTDSYRKLIDIEKAHERDGVSLEQAQLNLKKATSALNIAINHYGKESWEAQQASIDLKNAQFDLNDAQGLGKRKAEELAIASKQIKDKQDALTIATNGQERAQRGLAKATGDAKWAYVDMGVQIVSVAGNMSTLITKMGGFGGASALMTSSLGTVTTFLSAAGPWGIALGAAVIAMGYLFTKLEKSKSYADVFIENQKPVLDFINELKNSANLADQALGQLLEQEANLKAIRVKLGYSEYGPGTSMSSEQMMYQSDPNWAKTKAELERQGRGLNAPSIMGGKSPLMLDLEAMENANKNTIPVLIKNQSDAQKAIDQTGFMIGGNTKGSYPLVYSMLLAEAESLKMRDVSVSAVDGIIVSLNRIPKDIYTYHHIITVYSSSGGSSSSKTSKK